MSLLVRRSSLTLTALALLSLFAVVVRSQQDAAARGHRIIAHLNAVIQFYRSSTQPIQSVGDPSDIVYRDQAVELASQIASFAFQSAEAEAALLNAGPSGAQAAAEPDDQQKLAAIEQSVHQQIAQLQAREDTVKRQIAGGRSRHTAALHAQLKQLQGSLDLANAMKDALARITNMSEGQGETGLAAQINRLRESLPALQGNKTAAPQLVTLESARSSGVTSQGKVFFDLIASRRALDTLLAENEDLHALALALRTPLSNDLRALIQQGRQLTQQAEAGSAPAPSPTAVGQPTIDSVTARFKALSAATVPLSQEIILLGQSRSNITAWQSSVDREYLSIFHALLVRVVVIALALIIIVGAGELWTRATNKYIRDIRRRRQLLIVRRVVVTFLSFIVLLFGFVTQFNSLATFAGFITAGIAVGLQTILLSVAAYFFIIGRYGVKVGDRITIGPVTGDVIEVGLVRFYIMELAGSSTELKPTGRVAMFSNAVLFQAGTPLFKQMPGTEYVWHELIVKLSDSANYKMVSEAILKEVAAVYETYRPAIEHQHRLVQDWMEASIEAPVVESRLQFGGGTFQLWARYPVQITKAAQTDERLTEALFDLIASSPDIKSAIAATPVIQASVRG
jgi:small-conductance mechanosensitive channel